MIKQVENLMYQVSDFFLAPVLMLLVLLFSYSLFALGGFLCMAWQRKKSADNFSALICDNWPHVGKGGKMIAGYPLAQLWLLRPSITINELDVEALKQLEAVRTVSRVAPMLGLIATMIPMGPALKSLSNGDVQGISDNLIVAFSAVIFGLVIASVTFWIASIKKRWLAEELVALATVSTQGHAEHKEPPREIT